ncbi:MAG: anthranilate phosphoribosyltransferase [archaeon]
MIKEAIGKIVDGKNLSRAEAKETFDEIMQGRATDSQIASLITALRMKGESIEEIQGAAESMRGVAAKVSYKGKADLLDVVGTGGDGKSSFNISTASAFVCAGAGCVVAKHGNRSVSSRSGAADVLEALGAKIDNDAERNSEILSKIGIVFMFAQKHHPAMKYAAVPRKEIGIRTIFNILGPITNPAGANTFLLGVYSAELAEKLAFVLAGLGTKKAVVINGNGYDEATLTGKNVAFIVENGKVQKKEFLPKELGLAGCIPKELVVADAKESAQVIRGILSGKEKGAKRDTILLNAGIAIFANGKAGSIKEGIELARKSIDSGKALEKLELLVKESRA